MPDSQSRLSEIKETYREIYLIVAPPRTASTAFTRVIWEHPQVGFYCHEPFELVYHRNLALTSVIGKLNNLIGLDRAEHKQEGDKVSVVVKEMTFQVGKHFPLLVSLTTHPVIFLMRDPRRSILSRMQRRKEGNQPAIFPPVESGWHDLHLQVMHCKAQNIPYLIVDAQDFRRAPNSIFQIVLERLGLPFVPEVLSWQPLANVTLDDLGGEQSHWHARALGSTRIEAEDDSLPEMDVFPDSGLFRNLLQT